MGYRTFYQSLGLYGFGDSEVKYLVCVLPEEEAEDPDGYSLERLKGSIKPHDFEGILEEFRGGGKYQPDPMPANPPTMDTVVNFVSLLAFMEINGEDTFDSVRRNYELLDRWRNMSVGRPDCVFRCWMERICCPVVSSDGEVEVQQFTPFQICLMNQLHGIHDCDSLSAKLDEVKNSTDHGLVSLDQKRALVKAFEDLIEHDEVDMVSHHPLGVPMKELEVFLLKLGFTNCDVYVMHDIVGPRSLFHRLVAAKISIMSSGRLETEKKRLILKAIVYMENHDYCQSAIDKVAEFPFSQFKEWAKNQLVVI